MDAFFDSDDNQRNVVVRRGLLVKIGQVFDDGADNFFGPFDRVISDDFLNGLLSEHVFAKITSVPDVFGIR